MTEHALASLSAELDDVSLARSRDLRRQRITTVIRYTVLTLVGLIMIYPLVWLIGASFRTNSEIFANPGFWPQNPTIDGYIKGWKTSTPYSFGTFFLNTLWIVLPKMIGTAISCTAVAYGFARFEFPFKKLLFATLIATLLLPNVVTRIPQYLLFRDLGWLDTFLPLWVPSALAGDAFFVFMLVQFLRAIPRDMEEAARVDGIEAVSIVTPNHLHGPIATAFLDAGIHVICDKPVTTTSRCSGNSTDTPCRLCSRAPSSTSLGVLSCTRRRWPMPTCLRAPR